MQMGVTWYKLGERIDNGDDRLAKLFLLHACGHPEGTRPSHSSAFSADGTSQLMLVIHISLVFAF
jgi:hypothetical protein